MDRIRSEVYRDELKVESTKVTMQRGQLICLEDVTRMGGERLVRKIYDAQGGGKRKWGKIEENVDGEVRTTYAARGEKWEDATQMCRDGEKCKQWGRNPRNSSPHNPTYPLRSQGF